MALKALRMLAKFAGLVLGKEYLILSIISIFLAQTQLNWHGFEYEGLAADHKLYEIWNSRNFTRMMQLL